MSNIVKTPEQIEKMRQSCKLLAQLMTEVAPMIKEGVTPVEIDKFAYDWIISHNAKPNFLNYYNYPNTLCIGVNDMATHGVPTKRPFENGDIVTVDMGLILEGWHSDMARTFLVGDVTEDKVKFVNIVKQALDNAMSQAVEGNTVGHISYAIHSSVRPYGYSPLVEFVGHGIGEKMHEDPSIPGAYGKPGDGIELKEGMTLAIETLINMGKSKVNVSKKDGWTTRTADGSMFALFENTVLVGKNGYEILTKV